jgi:hypothetical protein
MPCEALGYGRVTAYLDMQYNRTDDNYLNILNVPVVVT